MSTYAVILVHTTSHAIQAERVLKRVGARVQLVPTPRQLSSDCGSALRIAAAEREMCVTALADAGVPIDRVAELDE